MFNMKKTKPLTATQNLDRLYHLKEEEVESVQTQDNYHLLMLVYGVHFEALA